jgi:hypothetical protein
VIQQPGPALARRRRAARIHTGATN